MHSRARMILVPVGLLVATVAIAGQIAGGCAFNFQDDPARDFCFGCPPQKDATSGGGATSSASGTTGGGETTGCTDAAECPVPAGPCASRGTATCAKGSCVVTYQAGPAQSQQYGDCATSWCDDTGTETEIPDAGNVYVNSGDPCITYPCGSTPGFPLPSTASNGMSCQRPIQMDMGYCEPDPVTSMEVCAECNLNTDCAAIPGDECSYGTCVPMHCLNGAKDADETGKDCGGPTCLPCVAGQPCQQAADCQSRICPASSICPTWSCSDNVQNGYETDIDCGGGCPLLCRNNSKCGTYKDCQSSVCVPSGMGYNICAAPTCTDGVQNDSETGIDCGGDGDGGPICPPCAHAGDGG
jgi:hypothetical protein